MITRSLVVLGIASALVCGWASTVRADDGPLGQVFKDIPVGDPNTVQSKAKYVFRCENLTFPDPPTAPSYPSSRAVIAKYVNAAQAVLREKIVNQGTTSAAKAAAMSAQAEKFKKSLTGLAGQALTINFTVADVKERPTAKPTTASSDSAPETKPVYLVAGVLDYQTESYLTPLDQAKIDEAQRQYASDVADIGRRGRDTIASASNDYDLRRAARVRDETIKDAKDGALKRRPTHYVFFAATDGAVLKWKKGDCKQPRP